MLSEERYLQTDLTVSKGLHRLCCDEVDGQRAVPIDVAARRRTLCNIDHHLVCVPKFSWRGVKEEQL